MRFTSRIAASRVDNVGNTIGAVDAGAAAPARDANTPISDDYSSNKNHKKITKKPKKNKKK